MVSVLNCNYGGFNLGDLGGLDTSGFIRLGHLCSKVIFMNTSGLASGGVY